jgi:predicted nucleic acid-binding protein
LIVYFDTSAFVPIIVEENTSVAASRLWIDADRVISSRLLYAETRAALAMANRLGRLDNKQLRDAVHQVEDLINDVDKVEVTDGLVRRAGALTQTLHLRGYDAVHLASAELVRQDDLVVATNDRALRAASQDLGLSVANLV